MLGNKTPCHERVAEDMRDCYFCHRLEGPLSIDRWMSGTTCKGLPSTVPDRAGTAVAKGVHFPDLLPSEG